ncbi:HAMP domain-containing sensor histidine kinase [Nocardioides sp. InS609-2]|uniref:sensor histidine kinase n=1 Tax=Nocardioides sp. InS609-2 TaxID=2760705 RepID=UPI0020C12F22|nr:HAMP domain-containing sensor histidine kinase [Nocardioides sp. InS609-2]
MSDNSAFDPAHNQSVARLFELMRRVNSSTDTYEVLGEVAGGVIELGFGAVALSQVQGPDMVTTYCEGPPGLAETILGDRQAVRFWVEMMDSAEHWGILRYIPHDRELPQWLKETSLWTPDIAVSDDPLDWHPDDMLIAPLYSATGELLGTMGFDLPPDGRIPDENLRELLELYVVQAGLALSNARQRDDLAERVRLGETVKGVAMAGTLVGLDSTLDESAELMTHGFSALQTWIRCFPEGDAGPQEHVAGYPIPNELGGGIPGLRQDLARSAWPGGEPVQLSVDQEDCPALTLSRATLQEQMRQLDVTHVAAVPIGVGQEMLGLLVMARLATPGEFNERELVAVGDIARELGRIVLNARLYERESRLVAELQELDRYKSELIATISHELKTPLTSIIGHVELLDEAELGATSVKAISRNAQRLDRLITNLLNYSSLQEKRAHVRRPVDLDDLCRNSVELLAFQAESAGISITLTPVSGGAVVSGDPDELGRIIDNLVGNAVKYSRRGGRVDVGASYAGDAAVVTVRDTGLGISQVDQSHLFSAFHRSSNPDALSLPGTGLGLAISRRIAELHGGDITVESEFGVGSTFWLRLPRQARLDSAS